MILIHKHLDDGDITAIIVNNRCFGTEFIIYVYNIKDSVIFT